MVPDWDIKEMVIIEVRSLNNLKDMKDVDDSWYFEDGVIFQDKNEYVQYVTNMQPV